MIPEQLGGAAVGVAGIIGVVILMVIAAASKRRARLTNELEQRLADVVDAFDSMANASRDRERLLDARMARLEQMIDTLAVETERIGEGQRHVSKLLVGRETQQEDDKQR